MEEIIRELQKEVSELRMMFIEFLFKGIISEVNISCELLEKDISDIPLRKRSKSILSELGIAKIKDLCAYSKQDLKVYVGATCWHELQTVLKDVQLPFGNVCFSSPDNKVYAIGRRSLPRKAFCDKWEKNVRCVEKNKVYGSIRECSDDLGIPYMTIYNAIINKNATRDSKLHFELIECKEQRAKSKENVCKKSMNTNGIIIDGVECVTQKQATQMARVTLPTFRKKVKLFQIETIQRSNRQFYRKQDILSAIENNWFAKWLV